MLKNLARSLTINAVSTLITSAVNLLQILLLAFIIGPESYGLAGIATAIVAIFSLFSTLGLGPSIIHFRERSVDNLQYLYWLALLSGVVFFTAAVTLSPLIAGAFSEPMLESVIMLASCSLLLLPIGLIPLNLLEQSFEFRRLAYIEILSSIAGLGASVASALLGGGALAVVTGTLTNISIRNFGYMLAAGHHFHPRLQLRVFEVSHHLAYGIRFVGQRLFNLLTTQGSILIIGWIAGATAVGRYSLAYSLVDLPSTKISAIFNRVGFPTLCEIKDNPTSLRQGYLDLHMYSTTFSVPASVAIAVLANPFAAAFPSTQWQGLETLIQILAVVTAARAIAGTVGPLLLASGQVQRGFLWSIFVFVVATMGVTCGAISGAELGAAMGMGISMLVVLVSNYFFLVRPVIGDCARLYCRATLPSLLISTSIILAGALSLLLFEFTNIHLQWLRFSVTLTACGASAALPIWYFSRQWQHLPVFAKTVPQVADIEQQESPFDQRTA